MLLALGSDHHLRLVEVPSLQFAARHMSDSPGVRARLFDMRHGEGVLLADVSVCAEDARYNLQRLTPPTIQA